MFYNTNEHHTEIQNFNFKVLIIDDDDNNIIFLKKRVNNFTKNIILAEDGVEGFEKFKELKPDIIISDISMPNLDGIEMSEMIRKIDKEIPIIIQTAINDINIIFKAIDIGISNYLLKPFKIESVDKILSKVFYQVYYKRLFQKQQDFIKTLSLALQYSSSIVIIADLRGNVIYANEKFFNFTGYEQSDNNNLEIDEIFESKSSIIGLILDNLSQNINKTELVLKLANGNLSWNYTTFNKITDANNNISLVLVLDDITALKINEQNLIQSNYILEEKVVKRTSELINAKDKAEEANKAKDLFLAKISHELRTPLNGIIGISDIMLHKEQSNSNAKFVKIIKNSGENLLRLINDIIDFTRLESNKFQLFNEDFNINETINSVSESFAALCISKNIEFKLNISKNLPEFINSDKNRISQIMYNLLSNSLKFTEKGEISLNVNKLIEDNKLKLKFEIKDTGIGIENEHKSIIFESFTQIENTYTRKYSGSGLGLSITKEIVDLFGGSINFESELGKGSLFTVIIPIKESVKSITQEKILSNLNNYNNNQNYGYKNLDNKNLEFLKNKNILIIEDSEINQEYYKELLIGKDANVVSAYSYKETFELIHLDYDLILIDCHIKDVKMNELFPKFIIDYYNKLQEIYKYDKEFWINHKSYFYEKVIVITADTSIETLEFLRKYHYNNILHKPFTINDFYNKINELFKNENLSRKIENKSINNFEVNLSNLNKIQNEELEDLDLFFKKLNKNAKLFEKIKNHFFNNIKIDLEKLNTYYTNNDNSNLNYLAHKLYSEISNFGFDNITRILKEIELQSKDEKQINAELFLQLEYYISILIEKFIKFETK